MGFIQEEATAFVQWLQEQLDMIVMWYTGISNACLSKFLSLHI